MSGLLLFTLLGTLGGRQSIRYLIGHTLKKQLEIHETGNCDCQKQMHQHRTLWDNKEIQQDLGGARLNKLLTAAYLQLSEYKIAWK